MRPFVISQRRSPGGQTPVSFISALLGLWLILKLDSYTVKKY